ncbi:MAG: tetratricopeptide repeat protein [Archangium sp.]
MIALALTMVLAAAPCTEAKAEGCSAKCDSGDAKACETLGKALVNGTGGVARDAVASQAAYVKGCDAGSGRSCNVASANLLAGNTLPKDDATGVALMEKACTLKHLPACTYFASFYDDGKYGVKKDPAKAAVLRTTACDAGGPEACFQLGQIYDEGVGVEVDKAKAHALYMKACGLKWGGGCFSAGIDFRDGEGTKADPKAMLKSLEQACTLDFNPSCSMLAGMYSEGTSGVKKDAKKAFNFAKTACERVTFPTAFEACPIAAQWARDGEGTKLDLKVAKRLADHGCINKNQESCDLAGVLEMLLTK